MTLEWNDAYSVGVRLFDQHHQRLFSILKKLNDIPPGPDGEGGIFNDVLNELLDYTIYHFETEENAMRQHGYPDYAKHREEHEYFISRIHGYYTLTLYGNLPPAGELVDFLEKWLLEHIGKSDKKYGPFLNAKGIS